MIKESTNSSLHANLLLFFLISLLLQSNIVFGNLNNNNTNATVSSSSSSSAALNASKSALSSIPASAYFATNATVNMADYTLLIYMLGSDLESQYYSATKDLIEMRTAASAAE